jgi:glycosyltransferase involved in cell wall biosynthesis
MVASVTLLMAVYNGSAFLPAQLQSLFAQTHPDWRLAVRDDGSTDGSPDLLAAMTSGLPPGKVACLHGGRVGHVAGFLSLLAQQPDDPGWLAFADQDDVWLPQRLSNGLELLSGAQGPALTAARVLRVAADLSDPRLTGAERPRPGFANALVENIAPGNTILANPAAAAILVKAARRVLAAGALPVAHDWWAYQMVLAVGGEVIFDPRPAVLYRQHGGNAVGANAGLRAAVARLRRVWSGVSSRGARANLAALRVVEERLTPEARALLVKMEALGAATGPIARLRLLWQMRLYRQSRMGTLALWAAAALGRV